MKFVFRLRLIRERRGLTQDALAKKVGVRQATISDLETGKSQRITFRLLERLARELGVPPKDFFDSQLRDNRE